MNEEDRIGDCLASLDFCDEVVVVDSHSTDRTREIAAATGARVIERDWPGFGPQKDFAAREAAHDWILSLDADERVSPELRDEILALRDRGFPGHAGWHMPRLSSYLGGWIRHGLWYPNRQLRLYDRRRGRWDEREPHPRVAVDGPVGRLAGDLLHLPYRSFSDHLSAVHKYTDTQARDLYARGRRARPWNLTLNPAFHFIRHYLLRLGFLDGWRGLVLAFVGAQYTQLKYVRILILQRNGESSGA